MLHPGSPGPDAQAYSLARADVLDARPHPSLYQGGPPPPLRSINVVDLRAARPPSVDMTELGQLMDALVQSAAPQSTELILDERL